MNAALHALHAAAGFPSARELQRALGGRYVATYTNIHDALTKPVVPQWPIVELLVKEFARRAVPAVNPVATRDRIKKLHVKACGVDSLPGIENHPQIRVESDFNSQEVNAGLTLQSASSEQNEMDNLDFEDLEIPEIFAPRGTGVWSTSFSPDGRMLAVGYGNGAVGLWSPDTRQLIDDPLFGYSRDGESINAVTFSSDGCLLAAGGNGGRVWVWDLATDRLFCQPIEAHRYVFALAFSPTRRILATAGENGGDVTARLWDLTTASMIHECSVADIDGSSAVAFSSDGQILVTGHTDGAVRFWDTSTLEIIGEPLGCRSDGINAVAFSPDGGILATNGSGDLSVRFWSSKNRERADKSIAGHKNGIASMKYSPDGRLMATTSWDKTILVWDLSTRRVIAGPLTGHDSTVVEAVFSPDASLLATAGGYDGKLRLWHL